MKLFICAAVWLTASPIWANQVDQKFENTVLGKFDAHLAQILPLDARSAGLRTRANIWMREQVAEFKLSQPRPPKGDWTMLPFAEAKADAVINEFILSHTLREPERLGRALHEIALFYAALATYRGNLPAQLTTGIMLSLASATAVVLVTTYAPIYYLHANADQNDLAFVGRVVTVMQTLLQVEGLAFAAAMVTALTTSSGRAYLRKIGSLNRRERGAQRIENHFWRHLQRRMIEASGSGIPFPIGSQFPAFFMGRLPLRTNPVDLCETWLTLPVAPI